MNILVSVIVPCYNQGIYLDETLQSVFDQTLKNWECLIINDGSTDDSEVIANKWVTRDNRFRYFKKENGGLSSARNLGLDNVNGEFVQFLDSDDILDKTKFEKSIKSLENQKYDLMISDFIRFKKNIKQLKRAFCNLESQTFSYKSILLDWDVKYSIPIHCGFFRAELVHDIRYNENLKAKEDWFFWIEFFRKKPKTFFINEKLAFYRMHKKGMTKNQDLMNENLKKAYLLIYDSLDNENKKEFFERLINEKESAKAEFKNFKDNVFYRKFFYFFKNIFN